MMFFAEKKRATANFMLKNTTYPFEIKGLRDERPSMILAQVVHIYTSCHQFTQVDINSLDCLIFI